MNVDAIVIDSGCAHYQNETVVGGINLTSEDEFDFYDRIGHGSAIINLIRTQNSFASIFVIKVCDSYNAFSYDLLCRAFDYIIKNNITAKIVNVSLGVISINDYSYLQTLISHLYKHNTLIVSAFSNDGLVSYPAAFNEVIGVDVSRECKKTFCFEYVENSIVNIRGSCGYYRAMDHNQNKNIFQGASFASAYVTGFLLKNTNDIFNGNDCLKQAKKS